MKRSTLACAVAAAYGAMGSAIVDAQEQEWVLEEVVVTAQKREQSLQDVGISVTAVNAEDIRNFRVETVLDIAQFATNVDIKSTIAGANPAITIRGVGLNDFNVNNNPTVGVYVDEIFLTSTAMLSTMMYDMERIEVLKGPQGTLYGRNTNGGAVNLLTARPTQEFEGRIYGGLGNYDLKEVEAMVSGPFTDNFGGRLALRYDDRDGYSKIYDGNHTFGDLENQQARGKLAYTGNVFSADFSLGYSKQKGTTVPAVSFGAQDQPGFAGWPPLGGGCDAGAIRNLDCMDFVGFNRGQYLSDKDDPYKLVTDPSMVEKSKNLDNTNWLSSLKLAWELDSFTITSVTGYVAMDRDWTEASLEHTPTVSPYAFIDKDEEVRQVTQELRIDGANELLDWLGGVFYSYDKVTTDNFIDLTNVEPINDLDAGLGGGDLAWDYKQETTSYAAFVHTEWHLGSLFNLIAAGRYTNETRSYVGGTTLADGDTPILPLTDQDDEITEGRWTGRLGLDFLPNDNWLIYGYVANGFKSGGYMGDFTFVQEELEPYDPETVLTYELGFKSTLARSTLQFNGAVFYYDYDNLQGIIANGTGGFPLTNAEDASIKGAELELAWRPVRGLDLRGGIGALDTELKDDRLAGDELPNAPKLQANLFARYEFGLGGSGLMMAAQTDAKYTDSTFRDLDNDPVLETDAYTLWNARLALFNNAASWEVAAWVKNITEAEYYPWGFNAVALNGAYARFVAPPRTFGASIDYRF